MKKNFLILAGIGALLLIILNWDKLMAFAKGSAPKAAGNNTPAGNVPAPAATAKVDTSGNANPSVLLKRGSKGASVLQLQQLIMDGWGAGYVPKYGADGDYGSETEAAVKAITGKPNTTLTTFRMNYYNKQKAAVPQTPTGIAYTPGSGLGGGALDDVPWYKQVFPQVFS